MGFLNRISNWMNTTGAKIYNGVRHGVSVGYNAVHTVGQKIGSLADGVDKFLTEARNIPVIGQVASTLQNNDKYQMARSVIKDVNDKIDTVGKIGEAVAKPLDGLITNTVFKGNPNITPL